MDDILSDLRDMQPPIKTILVAEIDRLPQIANQIFEISVMDKEGRIFSLMPHVSISEGSRLIVKIQYIDNAKP